MALSNFNDGDQVGARGPGLAAGVEAGQASGGGEAGAEQESSAQEALVRLLEMPDEPEAEPLPFSKAIGRMPVEVDVVVPVREFRVRHVLGLEPGQVIESRWAQGDDVPLTAGEVRLAWTEFEVIESQLAVRVTRLP